MLAGLHRLDRDVLEVAWKIAQTKPSKRQPKGNEDQTDTMILTVENPSKKRRNHRRYSAKFYYVEGVYTTSGGYRY
jgi:hypothetical protein